ncbi:hypothetical protein F5Y11DRAFT_344824 [Daldinia sp. FL1419]|nr:hypothetical protein F5Y11DRAFT_344824 [Daldinia sp. FL1419]
MCRKIWIHYMHHDVRLPMITSLDHDDYTVYANPLRTVYHQCEVDLPIPNEWILNQPRPCQYHSCCRLSEFIDFCDESARTVVSSSPDHSNSEASLSNGAGRPKPGSGGGSSENDTPLFGRSYLRPEHRLGLWPRAEACPYYLHEHYHKRLDYFGKPDSYPEKCPATWRENIEDFDGLPLDYFEQDPELLPEYTKESFRACEDYYQLEQDAQMHFLVYRDLAHSLPLGDPRLAIAEANVKKAQNKLTALKHDIAAELVWAMGESQEANKPWFVPIWWLRMWTVKRNRRLRLAGEERPANFDPFDGIYD